jgi:hypothetical protein
VVSACVDRRSGVGLALASASRSDSNCTAAQHLDALWSSVACVLEYSRAGTVNYCGLWSRAGGGVYYQQMVQSCRVCTLTLSTVSQ